MPGGVARCRDADHGAVAEDVVLAVHENEIMAQVEIFAGVHGGGVFGRRHAGVPFGALDDDARVRDHRKPAHVVEMQVRDDDDIDPSGILVLVLQLRRHGVGAGELDGEKFRYPLGAFSRGGERRRHAGIE